MTDEPNELFAPTVRAVTAALVELGFEEVVPCADGSEPTVSLNVDDGWLDVTVEYRPKADS